MDLVKPMPFNSKYKVKAHCMCINQNAIKVTLKDSNIRVVSKFTQKYFCCSNSGTLQNESRFSNTYYFKTVRVRA